MAQSLEYNLRRAAEIFQQVLYATVATSSDAGKPWNSPVSKFYDDTLNVYWFSDRNSMHSNNIRANAQIFVVIYDSTMPEGTGEAVYIEANAIEVNDPKEIERICAMQTGKMRVAVNEVRGDAEHRFYMAAPHKIWINDVEEDENGNYIRDIRVELPIKSLIRELKENPGNR